MTRLLARIGSGAPTLISLGAVVFFCSFTVVIGADSMWLVALGRWIIQHGEIPAGVPFAATDTANWINVPVLGELLFAGADALGDSGLLTLHITFVAAALGLLATSSRRLGAGAVTSALVLLIVVLGSLPVFGVVRAQTLSLPWFAMLLYLLRSQHHRPSWRVSLVLPLMIIWGNLHGAVLVGMAVAGSYLVFSRRRRSWGEAFGLGLAVLACLWLTPGGARTHDYYFGVLMNAAARRREGLWAPLDVTAMFDVLLIICGLVITGLALARRLPLWEYVVLAGLGVMTISGARHGIWLLLFASPRAAQSLTCICTRHFVPSQQREASRPAMITSAFASALVLVALAAPGLAQQSSIVRMQRTTAQAIAIVIGPNRSTVAPSPLGEWLATEGVMLWAGNPIDAFPQGRQSAYLDFLADRNGVAPRLSPAPGAVVLPQTFDRPSWLSPSRFRPIARVSGYTVFLLRDPP